MVALSDDINSVAVTAAFIAGYTNSLGILVAVSLTYVATVAVIADILPQ